MAGRKIVKQAEEFVTHLFRENSSSDNMYHDMTHTTEVVKNVTEIAEGTRLSDDDIEILKLAAWFHDIGYFDQSSGHEERSAEYARNFLAEHDYPREKIDKVSGCILATKLPQNPQNNLEEVICDADLLHFGKDNFFEKNELVRMEFERQTGRIFDEFEWLKDNIDLLAKHQFYTKYARENYEEIKNKHLLKLQKKLRKKLKKAGENDFTKINSDNLNDKKSFDFGSKKTERGVETMFRNVMRTHVSFSSMADSKANIMISVNTIIITILVSVMVRKLDSNPHLIIPTAMLTLVSIFTLVFAVLVTRPKVTAGTFTEEDIKNKDANLLFFGNFFNMDLDNFQWGMWEMIQDKDYLYASMIKDFYFLGQVLGQKYRYLRICYSVFMYGLIASVIAFAIAFALYPEGASFGQLLD